MLCKTNKLFLHEWCGNLKKLFLLSIVVSLLFAQAFALSEQEAKNKARGTNAFADFNSSALSRYSERAWLDQYSGGFPTWSVQYDNNAPDSNGYGSWAIIKIKDIDGSVVDKNYWDVNLMGNSSDINSQWKVTGTPQAYVLYNYVWNTATFNAYPNPFTTWKSTHNVDFNKAGYNKGYRADSNALTNDRWQLKFRSINGTTISWFIVNLSDNHFDQNTPITDYQTMEELSNENTGSGMTQNEAKAKAEDTNEVRELRSYVNNLDTNANKVYPYNPILKTWNIEYENRVNDMSQRKILVMIDLNDLTRAYMADGNHFIDTDTNHHNTDTNLVSGGIYYTNKLTAQSQINASLDAFSPFRDYNIANNPYTSRFVGYDHYRDEWYVKYIKRFSNGDENIFTAFIYDVNKKIRTYSKTMKTMSSGGGGGSSITREQAIQAAEADANVIIFKSNFSDFTTNAYYDNFQKKWVVEYVSYYANSGIRLFLFDQNASIASKNSWGSIGTKLSDLTQAQATAIALADQNAINFTRNIPDWNLTIFFDKYSGGGLWKVSLNGLFVSGWLRFDVNDDTNAIQNKTTSSVNDYNIVFNTGTGKRYDLNRFVAKEIADADSKVISFKAKFVDTNYVTSFTTDYNGGRIWRISYTTTLFTGGVVIDVNDLNAGIKSRNNWGNWDVNSIQAPKLSSETAIIVAKKMTDLNKIVGGDGLTNDVNTFIARFPNYAVTVSYSSVDDNWLVSFSEPMIGAGVDARISDDTNVRTITKWGNYNAQGTTLTQSAVVNNIAGADTNAVNFKSFFPDYATNAFYDSFRRTWHVEFRSMMANSGVYFDINDVTGQIFQKGFFGNFSEEKKTNLTQAQVSNIVDNDVDVINFRNLFPGVRVMQNFDPYSKYWFIDLTPDFGNAGMHIDINDSNGGMAKKDRWGTENIQKTSYSTTTIQTLVQQNSMFSEFFTKFSNAVFDIKYDQFARRWFVMVKDPYGGAGFGVEVDDSTGNVTPMGGPMTGGGSAFFGGSASTNAVGTKRTPEEVKTIASTDPDVVRFTTQFPDYVVERVVFDGFRPEGAMWYVDYKSPYSNAGVHVEISDSSGTIMRRDAWGGTTVGGGMTGTMAWSSDINMTKTQVINIAISDVNVIAFRNKFSDDENNINYDPRNDMWHAEFRARTVNAGVHLAIFDNNGAIQKKDVWGESLAGTSMTISQVETKIGSNSVVFQFKQKFPDYEQRINFDQFQKYWRIEIKARYSPVGIAIDVNDLNGSIAASKSFGDIAGATAQSLTASQAKTIADRNATLFTQTFQDYNYKAFFDQFSKKWFVDYWMEGINTGMHVEVSDTDRVVVRKDCWGGTGQTGGASMSCDINFAAFAPAMTKSQVESVVSADANVKVFTQKYPNAQKRLFFDSSRNPKYWYVDYEDMFAHSGIHVEVFDINGNIARKDYFGDITGSTKASTLSQTEVETIAGRDANVTTFKTNFPTYKSKTNFDPFSKRWFVDFFAEYTNVGIHVEIDDLTGNIARKDFWGDISGTVTKQNLSKEQVIAKVDSDADVVSFKANFPDYGSDIRYDPSSNIWNIGYFAKYSKAGIFIRIRDSDGTILEKRTFGDVGGVTQKQNLSRDQVKRIADANITDTNFLKAFPDYRNEINYDAFGKRWFADYFVEFQNSGIHLDINDSNGGAILSRTLWGGDNAAGWNLTNTANKSSLTKAQALQIAGINSTVKTFAQKYPGAKNNVFFDTKNINGKLWYVDYFAEFANSGIHLEIYDANGVVFRIDTFGDVAGTSRAGNLSEEQVKVIADRDSNVVNFKANYPNYESKTNFDSFAKIWHANYFASGINVGVHLAIRDADGNIDRKDVWGDISGKKKQTMTKEQIFGITDSDSNAAYFAGTFPEYSKDLFFNADNNRWNVNYKARYANAGLFFDVNDSNGGINAKQLWGDAARATTTSSMTREQAISTTSKDANVIDFTKNFPDYNYRVVFDAFRKINPSDVNTTPMWYVDYFYEFAHTGIHIEIFDANGQVFSKQIFGTITTARTSLTKAQVISIVEKDQNFFNFKNNFPDYNREISFDERGDNGKALWHAKYFNEFAGAGLIISIYDSNGAVFRATSWAKGSIIRTTLSKTQAESIASGDGNVVTFTGNYPDYRNTTAYNPLTKTWSLDYVSIIGNAAVHIDVNDLDGNKTVKTYGTITTAISNLSTNQANEIVSSDTTVITFKANNPDYNSNIKFDSVNKKWLIDYWSELSEAGIHIDVNDSNKGIQSLTSWNKSGVTKTAMSLTQVFSTTSRDTNVLTFIERFPDYTQEADYRQDVNRWEVHYYSEAADTGIYLDVNDGNGAIMAKATFGEFDKNTSLTQSQVEATILTNSIVRTFTQNNPESTTNIAYNAITRTWYVDYASETTDTGVHIEVFDNNSTIKKTETWGDINTDKTTMSEAQAESIATANTAVTDFLTKFPESTVTTGYNEKAREWEVDVTADNANAGVHIEVFDTNGIIDSNSAWGDVNKKTNLFAYQAQNIAQTNSTVSSFISQNPDYNANVWFASDANKWTIEFFDETAGGIRVDVNGDTNSIAVKKTWGDPANTTINKLAEIEKVALSDLNVQSFRKIHPESELDSWFDVKTGKWFLEYVDGTQGVHLEIFDANKLKVGTSSVFGGALGLGGISFDTNFQIDYNYDTNISSNVAETITQSVKEVTQLIANSEEVTTDTRYDGRTDSWYVTYKSETSPQSITLKVNDNTGNIDSNTIVDNGKTLTDTAKQGQSEQIEGIAKDVNVIKAYLEQNPDDTANAWFDQSTNNWYVQFYDEHAKLTAETVIDKDTNNVEKTYIMPITQGFADSTHYTEEKAIGKAKNSIDVNKFIYDFPMYNAPTAKYDKLTNQWTVEFTAGTFPDYNAKATATIDDNSGSMVKSSLYVNTKITTNYTQDTNTLKSTDANKVVEGNARIQEFLASYPDMKKEVNYDSFSDEWFVDYYTDSGKAGAHIVIDDDTNNFITKDMWSKDKYVDDSNYSARLKTSDVNRMLIDLNTDSNKISDFNKLLNNYDENAKFTFDNYNHRWVVDYNVKGTNIGGYAIIDEDTNKVIESKVWPEQTFSDTNANKATDVNRLVRLDANVIEFLSEFPKATQTTNYDANKDSWFVSFVESTKQDTFINVVIKDDTNTVMAKDRWPLDSNIARGSDLNVGDAFQAAITGNSDVNKFISEYPDYNKDITFNEKTGNWLVRIDANNKFIIADVNDDSNTLITSSVKTNAEQVKTTSENITDINAAINTLKAVALSDLNIYFRDHSNAVLLSADYNLTADIWQAKAVDPTANSDSFITFNISDTTSPSLANVRAWPLLTNDIDGNAVPDTNISKTIQTRSDVNFFQNNYLDDKNSVIYDAIKDRWIADFWSETTGAYLHVEVADNNQLVTSRKAWPEEPLADLNRVYAIDKALDAPEVKAFTHEFPQNSIDITFDNNLWTMEFKTEEGAFVSLQLDDNRDKNAIVNDTYFPTDANALHTEDTIIKIALEDTNIADFRNSNPNTISEAKYDPLTRDWTIDIMEQKLDDTTLTNKATITISDVNLEMENKQVVSESTIATNLEPKEVKTMVEAKADLNTFINNYGDANITKNIYLDNNNNWHADYSYTDNPQFHVEMVIDDNSMRIESINKETIHTVSEARAETIATIYVEQDKNLTTVPTITSQTYYEPKDAWLVNFSTQSGTANIMINATTGTVIPNQQTITSQQAIDLATSTMNGYKFMNDYNVQISNVSTDYNPETATYTVMILDTNTAKETDVIIDATTGQKLQEINWN